MSFWIYILRCSDGTYYTGHTDNLDKRIGEHQIGLCGGYTSTRLPVTLAWSQECATREEALVAELQVKGWSRAKKEAMMRGDWREVSRLATNKSVHPSTGSGRTDLLVASAVTCSQTGSEISGSEDEVTSVRPEPVEGPGNAE